MLGLGDVFCIGIPALRLLRKQWPDAQFGFLTFASGGEAIALEPGLDDVIVLPKGGWPNDILPAIGAFAALAEKIVAARYNVVYNLDTWFMPCFMARLLKDAGMDLRGNFTRCSVRDLAHRAATGTLLADDVRFPVRYMDSTFPNMPAWHSGPWWQTHPGAGAYPSFYINHCCGINGTVDGRLDVPPDLAFREQAGGRRIIALAPHSRTQNRKYPFSEDVRALLEKHGFMTWVGFDGSIPLRDTIARLKVTDLLVSVASSPQWMAAAAGCPVLMIPGPVPPEVLGADVTAPRQLPCQYCMQEDCIEDLQFKCMRVPPDVVADLAVKFLGRCG